MEKIIGIGIFMSCIKTSDVDPLVRREGSTFTFPPVTLVVHIMEWSVVSEKSDIFCLVSAQFDQIFVLRWQL
jgi:hypothetical protein